MTALSYTLISFPGLGLELDPPSTIQLGPLTIHFYGLIIAVGMLLAVLYASKRSKEFGLPGFTTVFSSGISTHPIPFPFSTSGTAAWPSTAACWVRSSA